MNLAVVNEAVTEMNGVEHQFTEEEKNFVVNHSENARFKIGWFGADLLCDVAHLGVDVIKQAGEIGHDRRCQQ